MWLCRPAWDQPGWRLVLLELQEEVGELTHAFLMRAGQARTKEYSAQGLEEQLRGELADVLCPLLARHHRVDLEAAIERKWLVRTSDHAMPATLQSYG